MALDSFEKPAKIDFEGADICYRTARGDVVAGDKELDRNADREKIMRAAIPSALKKYEQSYGALTGDMREKLEAYYNDKITRALKFNAGH